MLRCTPSRYPETAFEAVGCTQLAGLTRLMVPGPRVIRHSCQVCQAEVRSVNGFLTGRRKFGVA